MSLGKKIVAVFFVLGLSFSFGSFVALKVSVYPAFEDFERESSALTMDRVMQSIESDYRALEIMNMEYSIWSPTFEYVNGRRPDYPDENLDPAYWHSINIQMMLVFDVNGKLLYSSLADPFTGETLSLQDDFLQALDPGHPLSTHQDISHGMNGLFRTRSGIMQIASYPILKSEGTGPIAGSFVVGQFLTPERMAELSKHTAANVSLHITDSATSPPEVIEIMRELSEAEQSVRWEFSHDNSRGYQLLRDIFGNPVAVLEAIIPRRITSIGSSTVQTATTFLAVASVIFLLTAWLFMRHIIVAPLRTLTSRIMHIRRTGELRFEAAADRSDEIGTLAGEFGVMTSKLAQAQKELHDARDEAVEMSKTKSEFLARMSHEIRTPMNGVLGMTELLRDTALDSRQHRFADTIYESAESLLGIINDILDFSKIEAGKLQLEMIDVDLRILVEDIVCNLADQAQSKGLELSNVVPPDLQIAVQTDPVRLRQVLTNLVSNAIKFTESGEIVVRLAVTEVDDEHLSVLFEVADTGVGIRRDKQHVIFDLFTQEDGTTTRRYGGTGLGLSISKQIVDLMGGQLAVDSEPGKGATFSFALTMKTGCQSHLAETGILQCVAGKHVLIVDDNATNREILEHQLTSWRARADSAASAAQALAALESAVVAGRPYDLAILDMNMPVTDGLGCARAIRRNPDLSSLKLVILSSVAMPASEGSLRHLDISGQLTKPIRQSELYGSLISVLDGNVVVQGHGAKKNRQRNTFSGRVLLAEDNPVNQAVAVGMLEALGLTVEIASNGEEAVERATAETYDVILMDCQMPFMDGFEATGTIRQMESENSRSPVPIIAVTANALKGDRENCLNAGMDEYLTKPFTSEQLSSVLALILPQGESASAASKLEADNRSDDVPQSDDSPIDRSTLDVLSRLQKPGAPNILQKVINIYLPNSRELKDKLTLAINTANASLVRESAHALKSSSANVGATKLASLCKRLENMGRSDDLSEARTLQDRLEQEYARVVAALELEVRSAIT